MLQFGKNRKEEMAGAMEVEAEVPLDQRVAELEDLLRAFKVKGSGEYGSRS